MTDDYLNLDVEPNYCFDSYQHQFTSSRDSGMSSDETHKKDVPRTKKNISKYEPIYENNVVYRYEDNPEQYKKLRKRLQNRESATRVRGRQKNYVQDLESDMLKLKQENQELQLVNAKLQAENLQLKQQVSFMQHLILKGKQPDEQSQTIGSSQINPPFQMERVESGSRQLISLSAFTMIIGLIVFTGSDIAEQESVVSAVEVDNPATLTAQPGKSRHSYTLYLLAVVWLAYLVYVVGKNKLRFQKMKII